MKLTILTNSVGEIIATFQPKSGDANAPIIRIEPLDGQIVHEVEVSDNLAKPESVVKLHDTHLVEVIGNTATLIEK
jgi:hypothetical protein